MPGDAPAGSRICSVETRHAAAAPPFADGLTSFLSVERLATGSHVAPIEVGWALWVWRPDMSLPLDEAGAVRREGDPEPAAMRVYRRVGTPIRHGLL